MENVSIFCTDKFQKCLENCGNKTMALTTFSIKKLLNSEEVVFKCSVSTNLSYSYSISFKSLIVNV